MQILKCVGVFFLVTFFCAFDVCAQRLEVVEKEAPKAWIKSDEVEMSTTKKKVDVAKEEEKKEEEIEEKQEEFFMPGQKKEQVMRPTKDGTERGHTKVTPLMAPNEDGSEPQFILMYMENFVMERIYRGTPSCSMRFVVLTNLDQKVSQLAVKLVWPGIATTLSFLDIMPNTKTYYDYTLFGEGCYTMDVAPNVVVNRCRLKGSSARECANKIQWLRDVK